MNEQQVTFMADQGENGGLTRVAIAPRMLKGSYCCNGFAEDFGLPLLRQTPPLLTTQPEHLVENPGALESERDGRQFSHEPTRPPLSAGQASYEGNGPRRCRRKALLSHREHNRCRQADTSRQRRAVHLAFPTHGLPP